MITIGTIYTGDEERTVIARVILDDRQTGEYLLQDNFSACGAWFRTLDDLVESCFDFDFVQKRCAGVRPILHLHGHRGFGTPFTEEKTIKI